MFFYIDANYDLMSKVLFATPFMQAFHKPVKTFKLNYFKISRVFGIVSSQGKKLVFVTDRGANMIAALHGFTRLNCSTYSTSFFHMHSRPL